MFIIVLGCKTKSTIKEKKQEEFKIITYNIWYGYQDRKHSRFPCLESGEERKTLIYQWLKDQDADVVVFQELIDYSAEKLKEESQFLGHNYAVTLIDRGMTIGISSKGPIDVKEILTEGMHHGLIYCTVAGVEIIGTHLWPSFDEKILDEATIVGKCIKKSLNSENPVIILGHFNAFSS